MAKKLFLLDGMALVYRAHFALIGRPILNSKGVNTSALYGFTQTLLEILQNQQPSHIAVAFDTDAPTHRHTEFAGYKATRQAMPEELSDALPHVRRLIEALSIRVLSCDGFEADDIIGTLARRAEKEGFKTYMVTPDKDFGQLIDENTFMYKPGRMGSDVEIIGLPEIQKRWGIQRPEQVVDVLALMGDSTDNIPGVPGIGEKTAIKLIGQHGSVEDLLAHVGELTGRVRATLEENRDKALLSKRLATILCDAPCPFELESLKVRPADDGKLRALLVEFEFNSIGRRLYGEDFKAGRGFGPGQGETVIPPASRLSEEASGPDLPIGDETPARKAETLASPPIEDLVLIGETEGGEKPTPSASLKTIIGVAHQYQVATSTEQRSRLIRELSAGGSFSFCLGTTSPNPKLARLVGLAFSTAPHAGWYVPVPQETAEAGRILDEFRPLFESERNEKIGHDLKFSLSVLKWQGISVRGNLFDTLIAHSLAEPEMRHSLGYLCETFLGYSPIPLGKLFGESATEQMSLADVPVAQTAEYATESADVALQLRATLEPMLKVKGQERVFYEIESPLVPVLVDLEFEGIKVDAGALADFATQLAKEIDLQEKTICQLAGTTFNLNSARQLGQILFDVLKICEGAKKTRTGQYATDEQTLAVLAPEHEIVQRLLDYRAATKLKSTYADALPSAIWPRTNRIHTTFNQVMTTTGRLSSQDPNLQNIPIRTERGQEIRKAFVPRGEGYSLLSADYSQIELRVIAGLSREPGLLEAFNTGADVHTATAAKVYGVLPALVTPEMRRKAKMVNYGIAYGISAFGLSQRLGIPRKEASEIINLYFQQFPGIRQYMEGTIAFARARGYVETVTGRRRYIRDIRSLNHTVRTAAERNAINAPIQGTAADMIKIAMIHIHRELMQRRLKTRMLLQVHDELVFDLYQPEDEEVRQLIEEKMKSAIPLEVPIVVELGAGKNWLEAH